MRASRTTTLIATIALSATLVACGGTAQSTELAEGSSAASTSAAGAVTELPEADAEIEAATTVAYLGPAGTYTEEAAKLFFGEDDELMPQASVAEALTLVTDGTAAYAVIPQENALGGPVTDYIDALLGTDGVSVVGEVVLPIRQTLMGKPGTDLAQVKRVLSHKQGLAQSAEWLSEHLPEAKREEAASTAAAAQAVAEGSDSTTVAIAAPGAAELYGLEVLQDNVSLSDANKTRFYVVARDANELVGYQYAAFVADITADGLPGLLEEACAGGAELVCVHDRPDGSALGSYRYVIELEQADGFSADELGRLKKVEGLKYLGSYARIEG